MGCSPSSAHGDSQCAKQHNKVHSNASQSMDKNGVASRDRLATRMFTCITGGAGFEFAVVHWVIASRSVTRYNTP